MSEIEGLGTNIDTEYMDVYEYATGAVVNDEEWASFTKGRWVEEGQEAGHGAGGDNCCTLRWFTAYKNSEGYEANESPWEEPGWTMIPYTLQSAYSTGGPTNTWCYSISGGAAGCIGGVETYTDRVEVGMEAASEQEPVNGGKDETGVLHKNGDWYHWSKGTLEDKQWDGNPSTQVCASKWQEIPGYINFGTC